MENTQFFMRDGRWISRAQLLKLKELENEPEPSAESSGQSNVLGELQSMEIEDLQKMYEKLYNKSAAAAYKNDKSWLINKINSYEQ